MTLRSLCLILATSIPTFSQSINGIPNQSITLANGFTTNLQNYFPLNECTGTTVKDVIGGQVANVVTNGTATWTGDCALSFNGGSANRFQALGITNFAAMEVVFVNTIPAANNFEMPIAYGGEANSSVIAPVIEFAPTWSGSVSADTIYNPTFAAYHLVGNSNPDTTSQTSAPGGLLTVATLVLIPNAQPKLYINGREVVNYTTPVTYAQSSLSGGYLEFGGTPEGFYACTTFYCGYTGTIYGVATYSTPPSPQQVVTNYENWKATLRKKGVDVNQSAYNGGGLGEQGTAGKAVQILAYGESNSWCHGCATPSTQSFAAQSALTINGGNAWGFGYGGDGNTAAKMHLARENVVQAFSPAAINVVVLNNNANDCGGGANDATYAASNLINDAQYLRTKGFVVLVGSSVKQVGIDNYKNQCNAAGRAAVIGAGIDYFDYAEDPRVGADGAESNSTYYESDQIHMNPTLQAIVGGYLATYVNRLLFSSPTTTTAATYTMTGMENPLLANPASNSQVITPPACYGFTRRNQFPISNIQTSGTNTVTITPAANQGASFVIPNNTTMIMTVIRGTDSAAGCSWYANNAPTIATAQAASAPTLVGQYKASNITGVTSGNTITTWPDSSTGGHPLSVLAGAPKYIAASAINSAPGVRFGSAETVGATNFTIPTDMASRTVWAVINPSQTAASLNAYTTIVASSNTANFISPNGYVGSYYGNASPGSGPTVNTPNVTYIIEWVENGANSRIVVNGSNASGYDAGSLVWATGLTIGSDYNTTSAHFYGDMAEIDIYEGAPTFAQSNTTGAALCSTYNVTCGTSW